MLKHTLLAAALVAALPALAQQDYPNKPIRLIVPFAPGGNTDNIARIVSERVGAALGQTFAVENRAGAGGAIATELVAKSPPDGYTLLMSSLSQLAVVPFIQKVTYDPIKDFAPVSIAGTNPFVLGVHNSVPAANVRELVAYAKAKPGSLNFASGGAGSLSHISGQLFVTRAGLNLTHIPYRGGGPAVADLVAGQVQMYFGNASELIQHSRSGKIRLLGVSSEKRAPQLPELPAIAEFYPGFRTLTWNGFVAPAGTPRPIIERLASEIQKAVKEPSVADRLQKIGVDPWGSTPAEFSRVIEADIGLFRPIIREANIRVD